MNPTAHSSADGSVRVFFIGSGHIATPVLTTLFASHVIDLCGVATQADRPAGRKRKPRPTAISDTATRHGIEALKPESVNTPEFLRNLAALSPDIVLVFSFGQILRHPLLDLAPYGCLNIHTSLLPRHRGAAPTAAAILEGDQQTGVSFMRMERGLDTGPVYEMHSLPLDQTETAASLTTELAELAAEHIVSVLQRICRGGLAAKPQPEDGATYAPQLKKADGRMDWRKRARQLEREVRAYNPWPKSWFILQDGKRERRIQVLRAAATTAPSQHETSPPIPGTVSQAEQSNLLVACGHGTALRLTTLVPEGKQTMDADAFLRGSQLQPGHLLPLSDSTTAPPVIPPSASDANPHHHHEIE